MFLSSCFFQTFPTRCSIEILLKCIISLQYLLSSNLSTQLYQYTRGYSAVCQFAIVILVTRAVAHDTANRDSDTRTRMYSRYTYVLRIRERLHLSTSTLIFNQMETCGKWAGKRDDVPTKEGSTFSGYRQLIYLTFWLVDRYQDDSVYMWNIYSS